MLALKNERVVSYSIEYNDVYWEIESTREDLQEYDFFLERSEAEGGPWDQIAGPMIDIFYVRDNDVPKISHTRRLFYRVRVQNRVSGKELIGGAVSQEGELSLDAQEIVRLEQVLFQEFNGVQTWLYPRRSFGQRCPQCFDRVLNKRTDDSCPTCFGTSFSGGFHSPVEVFAQIDQTNVTEQVSPQLHTQTFFYGMRCGPTPFVKPLDLLIDNQNRRYRIIDVQTTSRLGVSVRHECRMLLLQRGAIEDTVPLRVDTRSVRQRPYRVYTNPHVLQGESKIPMDDVLRLYKY